MPNPHISLLPDDVLELVFRLLDYKGLEKVEATCQRWRRVVDERRLYR